MNIVCFGESLIDFKDTGRLAFQGYVGGSPLNVAVAASRLGADVGFAAQVSHDLFGAYIRRHMQENRIDTRFLLGSEAPSTLAFVEEEGGEAHFSFMANATADTLYDPQPRPEFPESLRLVMFGSISLLQEPAATAIVDTVAKHKRRSLVVFDPNVRPALIESREGYLEQLERWLALAHIVKLSTQDLGWLHPDTAIEDVARAWLEGGPEAVIVTRGDDGVSLFRRDADELTVSAPRVDVADTVGAGDTFTGGLMVRLLEDRVQDVTNVDDDIWRDVLGFAAAAAAINCTRHGAQPPYREELDGFLEGDA